MPTPIDPLSSDLDLNKSDNSENITEDSVSKNAPNEEKELLPWEENEGISEPQEEQAVEETPEKKIIDINLSSIDDIAELTAIKEYEYVIVEPGESEVKVSFKQDNIDKVVKYIKYPVYSQILLQLKQVTDMAVEETTSEQQ